MTNIKTTFLDMNIDIVNNQFHTKLFDKRDAFGFHINKLPFKDSNIPHRMFYSRSNGRWDISSGK